MPRSRAAWSLVLFLAFAASLPAISEEPLFSPEAAPSVSSHDIVLLPPSGGPSRFRFLPDGPWLPFSRPLELSAAPGEERYYTIETRTEADASRDAADAVRSTILIDKRCPEAPRIEPASGLYREPPALSFSPEAGSVILYSLFPSEADTAAFAYYDAASFPGLGLPASGSETWVLLAYAEDGAGNRSSLVRREYRLAPPGPAFSPPPQDQKPLALQPDTLSDLASPRIFSTRGRAELVFTVPRASRLLAAVNPPSPPDSPDDFYPLETDGQTARLSLSCPYGWSGKLSLYLALSSGDAVRCSTNPLVLPLSDSPSPQVPGAPFLVSGRSGGPAFLVFPAYSGRIRFSLGDGPEEDYLAPFPVKDVSAFIDVKWHGLDDAGKESESLAQRLSPLPRPPRIGLSGLAEGEWRNSAVRLEPTGEGVLRYELATDGSTPPEPRSSSPLLGKSLSVDCPEGEERLCILRYRSFSGPGIDAVGGEGSVLSFHLDRKPPSPPRPVGKLPAFSPKSLSLKLESGEGEIYAMVEVEGKASKGFERLEGEIALPGSREEGLSYRVRAYVLDRAGNKSPEMGPISCLVDLATVYVSESGSDSGDGGRIRPLASLDAAIALANAEGRREIKVAGKALIKSPVSLKGQDIAILGGFDQDWKGGASSRSRLSATLPSGSKALFLLDEGSLGLSNFELDLGTTELATVFSARSSGLRLSNMGISASSASDILVADIEGTRLELKGSSLALEGARSGSMVSARDCDVRLEGSRLSAGKGVRYYGALNLQGGSLELKSSTLASQATLGTRLLILSNSGLKADSCLFSVSGGTGFLSIGNFEDSPGLVSNCRFLLDWTGDATLFRTRGSPPSFIHDSVRAAASGGASGSASLRFFECDGDAPVIGNCVIACLAKKGELVVSRNAPRPGDLFSSCLWGFQSFFLGGKAVRDLDSLNRFNAPSAMAGKPCFLEDPSRTFARADEGGFVLNAASRCVDGASTLPGQTLDFSGKPRAASPDIGADEL